MGSLPERRAPPSGDDGGRTTSPFRFSFTASGRYRRGGEHPGGRPLFRRWEAAGLLLLVTVGAAFVPGARGEPAAGTVLMDAAAGGHLRARFFSLAPPLLAFLFAWRAAGRLVRPFQSFAPVVVEVTLSAVLVYLAFHLGLFLALQTYVADSRPASPWLSTLPGAIVGWALILVVASIRLAWGRAAADLTAARRALDRDQAGKG